jgi:hypothetical protein
MSNEDTNINEATTTPSYDIEASLIKTNSFIILLNNSATLARIGGKPLLQDIIHNAVAEYRKLEKYGSQMKIERDLLLAHNAELERTLTRVPAVPNSDHTLTNFTIRLGQELSVAAAEENVGTQK